MIPIPRAATPGASHTIMTVHSTVGTKTRCTTGQATQLATTANTTNPNHEMATAGSHAPRTLA